MIEFGNFDVWVWLLIIFAAGSAAYCFFIRPSYSLFALRVTVIVIALFLLIQPTQLIREQTRGKPLLAVLVDNSLSMKVKDPEIRIERVKRFIKDRIPEWKKKVELKFYLFSGATTSTGEELIDDWKGRGDKTHIGHAISEVGQELSHKLSAMLLISDGQDNGALHPPSIASEQKVPVFTVGVGSVDKLKDILIVDVRVSDIAFKNTPVPVSVIIKGFGFSSAKIPVRLYQGDTLISTREAVLTAGGGNTEVSFEITPKNVGTFTYRLSIPQFPDEASVDNNTLSFTLNVIREKLRILYICGQPGYEYAFLREALKSDPAVELVSFVILRNPENSAFVPDHELSLIPFPAREIFLSKLFSFDLLIFENFTYMRFGIITPYLENIRTFVKEKGGAFIMIGGQNSFGMGAYRQTPIADILPVDIGNHDESFSWESFKLKAENVGHPIMTLDENPKKNRSIWFSMPALAGCNIVGNAKPGAVVLGEHPFKKNEKGFVPVLVVWQKGKGRVMTVSSNSTWRWAMGLARSGETPFGYARFWRGAVRWLTQAEDMKLLLITTDKKQYTIGETIQISIMVKDEAYDPLSDALLSLRAAGTSMPAKEIKTYPGKKGEFRAEFEPLHMGTFTLEAEAHHAATGALIGTDTRTVDVRSFSKEQVDLLLNEQLLTEVASQSGGTYAHIEQFDTGELLTYMRTRHRGEVTRKKPLWNHPFIFVLIIILLGMEWYIRRRMGLP